MTATTNPVALLDLSPNERVSYRAAYGHGYADGWRAGAAFAARSDELSEQTRATIVAGIEAFRADHEKRRAALQGGGAR